MCFLILFRRIKIALLNLAHPRASSHGIKLSAREAHAWAVSLSIALSQGKVYNRMPATRLEEPAKKKPTAKSIQSPGPGPSSPTIPFSNPTIAPALRQLRQLLVVVRRKK